MTIVLMPVPKRQWREPSQAQPKDQFGNQNCTRFRLTARLNDGFIRWRGWFDSRDDADAFLYALALNIIDGTPVPVEMWRLPSPWWHPDLGEGLTYDFATLVFLTASPGSLQSWTSAVDWWNSNNTIEALAAGGSGGIAVGGITEAATGGGGGEYRKLTNFSIAAPGTTTISYEVGVGGTARVAGSTTNGVTGGQTWWNGASFGAASLGANGGIAGNAADAASVSGAAGGGGGSGGTGNNGGGSGNVSGLSGSNLGLTGGGGAGGPNGSGNTSAAQVGAGTGVGASGDAGSGGGGGAVGTTGGNGAEWDGSHGSGGGGGSASVTAGSGGTYGAGGGAAGHTSGAGTQGIVVLTYMPLKRGAFFALF